MDKFNRLSTMLGAVAAVVIFSFQTFATNAYVQDKHEQAMDAIKDLKEISKVNHDLIIELLKEIQTR